jgi:hypothetical protein
VGRWSDGQVLTTNNQPPIDTIGMQAEIDKAWGFKPQSMHSGAIANEIYF